MVVAVVVVASDMPLVSPAYNLACNGDDEDDDSFVGKVDVDKVPEIKSVLSVWAMPTFTFLRNGNVVGSFMGADVRKLRYGLNNGGKVGICGSCTIL